MNDRTTPHRLKTEAQRASRDALPLPVRILLIDDHAVVREGLKHLLEATGEFVVVAEADSGEMGYRAYFEHHPDVVLLDLKMPGEGGLATLRRIRRRDITARVIILTMFDDVVFPKKALEEGAVGYLSKGCKAETLFEAIRCCATGGRFVEPALAQNIILAPESKDGPAGILTPREFEVFCMLARGDSVREIAQHLHLSPKTVNVHRGHILKKLKVKNPVHLAHIAIHHGIIPDGIE